MLVGSNAFFKNIKGFKSKDDILKDKKNYRKPTKKVEQIYDYNWLEDE